MAVSFTTSHAIKAVDKDNKKACYVMPCATFSHKNTFEIWK